MGSLMSIDGNGTLVLLSVSSVEENISKYYFDTVALGKPASEITEITKAQFDKWKKILIMNKEL